MKQRCYVYVCLALAGFSCTIGETVEDTAAADLWAVNRPFRNGCSLNESAGECAARKGGVVEFACGFIERTENAYFKIGQTQDADGVRWVVERSLKLLHSSDRNLFLGELCKQTKKLSEEKYIVTMVPTPVGCAELGGTWRAGYCASETGVGNTPDPLDHFYEPGTLDAGVPKYLPVISVRPGGKIVVGLSGTGNPDLYVRFNDFPTAVAWDCRDSNPSDFGYCALQVPRNATSVFVAVYSNQAASYAVGVQRE